MSAVSKALGWCTQVEAAVHNGILDAGVPSVDEAIESFYKSELGRELIARAACDFGLALRAGKNPERRTGFYTIHQACRRLGISKEALLGLVGRGELRSLPAEEQEVRFRKLDIDMMD